MTNESMPGGVVPMPSTTIRTYLAAYAELCTGKYRDEPIEATVEELAARLRWPVGATATVTQWCWERDLIDVTGGLGDVVTGETVVEGRYRR